MNLHDLPSGLFAEDRPLAGESAPEASQSRVLMDKAQTGLYVVQDARIAYANPVLGTLVGAPSDQLLGRFHWDLLPPGFQAHAEAAVQRRLQGKPGRPGEVKLKHCNGSTLDVRVLARRIEFNGRPAVLVTVFDISELKEALRRAEWNASMLARTEALCRAGSFEIAWPAGQLHISAGLAALLLLPDGAPRDASLDRLPWIPPQEQAYVAGIWRSAVVGEPFEFQHRLLRTDGQRLVVLHRGLLGDDGHGVALLQDVSAQMEAAERIHDLATHHEVTGLPNRTSLLDQLDAAVHTALREQRRFALLAIDLPRIAEIKGSMGFGAGDALCMALAARLRAQGDTAELVAHLGETEFALLLEIPQALAECGAQPGAAADPQTSADADSDAVGDPVGDPVSDRQRDSLLQQAVHFQHSLQRPVRLGTTDVHAQCAIGIALFPADGQTAAALLESAQTARLDVSGGAGVAFFRPESTQRARREMQIESALWQALARHEFELHYQPQVDLASGAISGAEALLRWRSPELGAVSPGEFIPVAERCGLIGAIGDWVLRQACCQLAAWKQAGVRPVRVAVNLASSQLQQPDLAARVQALLDETGADAASLGIELTESMVMSDVEGAAAVLRALKAMGIQISLDDFGTGFSSLSYLSRLPIDVVKVDRSFVRDVTADAHDVSVTRAIIQMTHGLQMRSLAEGVETDGQLSLLMAAGCDEFQGFWFSRPVPAAEFEALLSAGKCLPQRFVQRAGGQHQRTLLLVDDEPATLAMLQPLLAQDGWRVLTAEGGAQGLHCLSHNDVDVIVSDQSMPGMTGVEFLHRARLLYPETVRIVLSGHAELKDAIDAVNQVSISKFLTKPWDSAHLREQVADAFRQKRLADDNRHLARQLAQSNAALAAANERLAARQDEAA